MLDSTANVCLSRIPILSDGSGEACVRRNVEIQAEIDVREESRAGRPGHGSRGHLEPPRQEVST